MQPEETTMIARKSVEDAYKLAKDAYAALGVNTEEALAAMAKVKISLHCWQTDDVGGFENPGSGLEGIQATGNYPGKARTIEQVRGDLEEVLRLLPGKHGSASTRSTGISRGSGWSGTRSA